MNLKQLREKIISRYNSPHPEIKDAISARVKELEGIGHTIKSVTDSSIIHSKNGDKFKTSGIKRPDDKTAWITQEKI